MKKQITIFIAVLVIGINSLKAQTNIGSQSAPDASAQLQITSSTKGVLMPKVALTATTTFTLSGGTNTAGMVVYNTNATITGTPAYPAYGTGLYTWDGTGWKGTPVLPVMPTLPQTVLIASGDSLLTVEKPPISLKLNSVPLNDIQKVSIIGDTTIKILVKGTYKIDAIVAVNTNRPGNAAPDNASISARLMRSSSFVLQENGLQGQSLNFVGIPISYIVSVTVVPTLFSLQGRFQNPYYHTGQPPLGYIINQANFQVLSLQVQQIK